MNRKPINRIPPLSAQEMKARGIDGLDFVYISGDAYIDHPSFGTAIIARVLQSRGYSVGILAQPDWHDVEVFRSMGKPRLGFLVSAGNLDSMVDHYTAAKRRRSDDAYTPGGRAGKRPDRAVIVYANRCREAFPHVPVLIGGIEASLRRFAHYDYWDDRVRHSILYDAGADILMYGMGERSVVAIADALDAGVPVHEIRDVPGTCFRVNDPGEVPDAVLLPSYTEVAGDKRRYAEAFKLQFEEQDAIRGRRLIQAHEKGYLVQNPPQAPLSTEEMDAYAASASVVPRADPRDRRGQVFDHLLPRVLRRLQFLRADVPSGTRDLGAKPRVDPQRSAGDDEGSRVQGLHPRRRRTDRELPKARVS